MAEKPWPLWLYAPGNYMCKCVNCLVEFTGDKRAVHCLECAASFANRSHASLEARVKRLEEALDTCIKQLGLNIDEADWPDAYDRHALGIAVAALKDIPDA